VVILLANGYFLVSWLRLISPVLLKTLREKLSALFHKKRIYRVQDAPSVPSDPDKPSSSSPALQSSNYSHSRDMSLQGLTSLQPVNTPVERELSEQGESSYTFQG